VSSTSDAPVHALPVLQRSLRLGGIGFAAALPLVALAGWLVDGTAGLWGAVLGLAVPAFFFGATLVVALITVRLSPAQLGTVVMVSWLAKLILVVVVLVLLDQSQAWSRPVFGVVFMLSVAVWLGLEAWLVLRTRQPYVTPVPSVRPRSPGASSDGVLDVGSVRASHDRQE
jgi:hypothetical protein